MPPKMCAACPLISVSPILVKSGAWLLMPPEPNISNMASTKSGDVRRQLTISLFLIAACSSLPASSRDWLIVAGSRSMPHLGHDPGLSEITSGCIGQIYWLLPDAGAVGGAPGETLSSAAELCVV